MGMEREREERRARVGDESELVLPRCNSIARLLPSFSNVSTYRNGVRYSDAERRIVFRTVKWKQKATRGEETRRGEREKKR